MWPANVPAPTVTNVKYVNGVTSGFVKQDAGRA